MDYLHQLQDHLYNSEIWLGIEIIEGTLISANVAKTAVVIKLNGKNL